MAQMMSGLIDDQMKLRGDKERADAAGRQVIGVLTTIVALFAFFSGCAMPHKPALAEGQVMQSELFASCQREMAKEGLSAYTMYCCAHKRGWVVEIFTVREFAENASHNERLA